MKLSSNTVLLCPELRDKPIYESAAAAGNNLLQMTFRRHVPCDIDMAEAVFCPSAHKNCRSPVIYQPSNFVSVLLYNYEKILVIY